MKTLRVAAIAVLAIAGTGLAITPAWADPPPWAPAHGWRAKHQYVYYPSAEVYYAPTSRMWFWLGGNGWQAGVSLPMALQGYVQAGGVNISLDVDRPYLQNEYVVRRYGGHQRQWWHGDGHHGHGHGHDNGHEHDHGNGNGHGHGH